MKEINRLRSRLRNIQKNVVEYRMTVQEAKTLLEEIDNLLKPTVVEKPIVAVVEERPQSRILDGGSF